MPTKFDHDDCRARAASSSSLLPRSGARSELGRGVAASFGGGSGRSIDLSGSSNSVKCDRPGLSWSASGGATGGGGGGANVCEGNRASEWGDTQARRGTQTTPA